MMSWPVVKSSGIWKHLMIKTPDSCFLNTRVPVRARFQFLPGKTYRCNDKGNSFVDRLIIFVGRIDEWSRKRNWSNKNDGGQGKILSIWLKEYKIDCTSIYLSPCNSNKGLPRSCKLPRRLPGCLWCRQKAERLFLFELKTICRFSNKTIF